MDAALDPQADPYSVLNLRRDASDEEIKRAYKYVQAPALPTSRSPPLARCPPLHSHRFARLASRAFINAAPTLGG
jgi:hypothetical protein